MDGIVRARRPDRLPVVLTHQEVGALLASAPAGSDVFVIIWTSRSCNGRCERRQDEPEWWAPAAEPSVVSDGSKMIRPETSVGLARRSDVVEIALMSRDLIEKGLRWAWTPSRVAASVRRSNTIVVVVRAVDRIAGFGIMRYGDDEAHLDLLGVDHDYRRGGLGRRLVEWLEKPALVAGISAVFLEVRGSNLGAQTFYERLGYRKLANIAHYYQGRESAIRMGRELGCRGQPASDVWLDLTEALRPTRPPGAAAVKIIARAVGRS
jgi:[ribosomal protein S18]-alanine N-acetyltransferase